MAAKKFKAGLDVPIDMTAFTIRTAGRTVTPFDGEHVWIVPYLDSRTELELTKARDKMAAEGEATAEANFALVAEMLGKFVTRWDLTDAYGEPIAQGDFYALPARAILFLMNEALGVEPVGEGQSG